MLPYLLSDEQIEFPDPNLALTEPNGLLAIGGDLSPARLIAAYQRGIFPWYNPGEPILWWSPNPRAVLFLDQLKISHSLAKTLRKKRFKVTFDSCFPAVINACAETRWHSTGTWISPAMIEAYVKLYDLGIAHSIEIWNENQLVGGLYGLCIGQIFCGESMFSKQTDASKVALVHLVNYLKTQPCLLIDCQVPNPHLHSLGATTIPRQEFLDKLSVNNDKKMILFPAE